MKLEDLVSCEYCGSVYLKGKLVTFNDGTFRRPHNSKLCEPCAQFAREELR